MRAFFSWIFKSLTVEDAPPAARAVCHTDPTPAKISSPTMRVCVCLCLPSRAASLSVRSLEVHER